MNFFGCGWISIGTTITFSVWRAAGGQGARSRDELRGRMPSATETQFLPTAGQELPPAALFEAICLEMPMRKPKKLVRNLLSYSRFNRHEVNSEQRTLYSVLRHEGACGRVEILANNCQCQHHGIQEDGPFQLAQPVDSALDQAARSTQRSTERSDA